MSMLIANSKRKNTSSSLYYFFAHDSVSFSQIANTFKLATCKNNDPLCKHKYSHAKGVTRFVNLSLNVFIKTSPSCHLSTASWHIHGSLMWCLCHCWGPEGFLDIKIGQIDLCHTLMSYVSFEIKCHIMTIKFWKEHFCRVGSGLAELWDFEYAYQPASLCTL